VIIRIARDKHNAGARIQIVDGMNRTAVTLQSRAYPTPSDARHDARRLFGPLAGRAGA
jgi:hypothetical protein